ncbi:hypothetical protein Psch_00339 [Pelotomaculum schinkii]|uniref:Uncharacterized protein n=1 Tax=Pelotomaculum schinkii TaxID=78350 RepID=A0A4Y7RES1_9FIRM|nr:hypothetical protein Psch_00339 [Pelotomaculum schinkii]
MAYVHNITISFGVIYKVKINYEDVRQKYINAAILHRKSSYNGDYKTANKQYKVLKKIYDQIEKNVIEKKLLLDLLEYNDISVKSWAAAHMLGIKYEISKAEKELINIATIHDAEMIGFSAKMTLNVWAQQGFLKF